MLQPNTKFRSPDDLSPAAREHYVVAKGLGGPFDTARFKARYHDLYPGRKWGSILPSDYCFNHNNEGNRRHPRFLLRHERALYSFVGMDGTKETGIYPWSQKTGELEARLIVQRVPTPIRPASTPNDPLEGFNWSTLYKRYDDIAHRHFVRCFNRYSDYLRQFESTPTSERDLYYRLVKEIHHTGNARPTVSIDQYQAILYWKLYSQPAALSKIVKPLSDDDTRRREACEALTQLLLSLPTQLERDTTVVVNLIRQMHRFSLWGMKSRTSLPVRTTFLHFIFPDVVPIFDKMVLQAVSLYDKNANKRISTLQSYLPLAWELAERYSSQCAKYPHESPLRVVDMALWIIRNEP